MTKGPMSPLSEAAGVVGRCGLATVLRPRQSPFVSRVSYALVGEISTDRYPLITSGMQKTKRRILEWLGTQVGRDMLDAPVDEPFDETDAPGVKIGVAISSDASVWVAKMERPDKAVPQRSWVTEAAVVSRGDAAVMTVRNAVTAPAEHAELPRSVPGFVRKIADIVGLDDAGEPLSPSPWVVEDEDDLSDLFVHVHSASRVLPVVLVTEPSVVNVDALAERLFSVAHVVLLPERLNDEWTTLVGRPLTAFRGAVRTYNPSLDFADSDPYDHPVALAGRIREFDAGTEHGPAAFETWLVDRTYAQSVSRFISDERMTRYSQVRTEALAENRERAQEANQPVDIAAMTAEIAAYQKQVSDATQMEAAALADNEVLSDENERLKRELYQVQIRIADLESREPSAKADEAEFPDTFAGDAFTQWCEKRLSGRVLLLPRAIREIADSDYERPDRIFGALLLLANEFWRMKAGLVENAEFERAAAALQLEYGGSIDERFADESYYVRYRDKRRFLSMALKSGNSRESRYCLRVYTFWDEDLRISVVGSLPKHLDNSLT